MGSPLSAHVWIGGEGRIESWLGTGAAPILCFSLKPRAACVLRQGLLKAYAYTIDDWFWLAENLELFTMASSVFDYLCILSSAT